VYSLLSNAAIAALFDLPLSFMLVLGVGACGAFRPIRPAKVPFLVATSWARHTPTMPRRGLQHASFSSVVHPLPGIPSFFFHTTHSNRSGASPRSRRGHPPPLGIPLHGTIIGNRLQGRRLHQEDRLQKGSVLSEGSRSQRSPARTRQARARRARANPASRAGSGARSCRSRTRPEARHERSTCRRSLPVLLLRQWWRRWWW
jgi:hypothetical protein